VEDFERLELLHPVKGGDPGIEQLDPAFRPVLPPLSRAILAVGPGRMDPADEAERRIPGRQRLDRDLARADVLDVAHPHTSRRSSGGPSYTMRSPPAQGRPPRPRYSAACACAASGVRKRCKSAACSVATASAFRRLTWPKPRTFSGSRAISAARA